jgi:hypothetical protein
MSHMYIILEISKLRNIFIRKIKENGCKYSYFAHKTLFSSPLARFLHKKALCTTIEKEGGV